MQQIGRRALLVGALVMVVMVAAACGNDDGAGVRNIGGSGSGSGSASGSASASGSSSGSHVASGTAECHDVGDASSAETEVHVNLDEWSVVPEVESIEAGTIHFEAINIGEEEHELVIVKADSADDLPLDDDESADEEQLPGGAFIGEIEAFPAGEECNGTFDLAPGSYVLFCNLVDGDENHFQLGMRTEFEVE